MEIIISIVVSAIDIKIRSILINGIELIKNKLNHENIFKCLSWEPDTKYLDWCPNLLI